MASNLLIKFLAIFIFATTICCIEEEDGTEKYQLGNEYLKISSESIDAEKKVEDNVVRLMHKKYEMEREDTTEWKLIVEITAPHDIYDEYQNTGRSYVYTGTEGSKTEDVDGSDTAREPSVVTFFAVAHLLLMIVRLRNQLLRQ